MSLKTCPHRPPCPASRWWCGQRTTIERAVDRGLITRVAGASLLRGHGVPMTLPSRVETGKPTGPTQRRLVE